MRALAAIETDKRSSRASIIIREIPYQVNKARMIERMAELVNDKRIEGISDIRDESDRDGMRIVIELKRDAEPRIVLNQLYKLTQMQQGYGIILLGIHEGRPKEMTLLQMLVAFLEHRKIVLTRRTRFELREAEARLHILDGLLIALNNLDAVIKLIRGSKDAETARTGLMKQFGLSQLQAQAILDLTLRRLTSLEREKIENEHKETLALIAGFKKILADEKELLKLIADELDEIKKEFADPRRTQIVEAEGDFSIEDLIVEEDVLVSVTHGGYIKRTPLSLYRTQKRGGRGKDRRDHHRRGFRRASRARLDARPPAVLHQRRQGLRAQGLRAARGRARRQGTLDRQPAEPRQGRNSVRFHSRAARNRRQVCLLLDPPRPREKNRARRV